jgi:hypothetical protein
MAATVASRGHRALIPRLMAATLVARSALVIAGMGIVRFDCAWCT